MKVKYIGCSETQYYYGGGNDPRNILVENNIYEVIKQDIHDWHAYYHLKNIDSKIGFNSVCFEPVKD